MTGDDTGTDLRTVVGAWEELEGGGVAVCAGVLHVFPEGGGNARVVA